MKPGAKHVPRAGDASAFDPRRQPDRAARPARLCHALARVGIGGLFLDDFEPYKRPYRGAPGGHMAVPASAGPAGTSLLAIPTDPMGNLSGIRFEIAGALQVGPYAPYGA